MSEVQVSGPPRLAAGHVVIYQAGVVAFHMDDCDHVMDEGGLCEKIATFHLPSFVVPLLAKALAGELSEDDLKVGPLGMLGKVMRRG